MNRIKFTSEGGWYETDAFGKKLPKRNLQQEIADIFADPSANHRGRLAAFMLIETKARRGGPSIRDRQQIIKDRILKINQPPKPLTPSQWREKQYKRKENFNDKRAEKSGDKSFALRLAQSYHKHIKSLFQSKRATITYGLGGQEQTDWDAYGKNYGYPANWKNAGVYVSYKDHGPGTAIIQTSRGTTVAEIPLPKNTDNITFSGLLDGDLWATKHKLCGHTILRRFALKRKKIVQVGIAVFVNGYWEHGTTIAEVKKEIKHKQEIAKRQELEQRNNELAQKLARWIATLCNRLVVKYDDARAVGYCHEGIKGFQGRYNLTAEATVQQLRDTKTTEVEKPIRHAALKLAMNRLTEFP